MGTETETQYYKTIEILKKLYIIIEFPFPFPRAPHHPITTCRWSHCMKLTAQSAPRQRPHTRSVAPTAAWISASP